MTSRLFGPRASAGKFFGWCVLIVLLFIADQGTKYYFEHNFEPWTSVEVTSFFNLVLAHNHGAAFSFLSDAGGWQQYVFLTLAGVISLAALYGLWKQNQHKLFSLSMSCIIAGALGNAFDRMYYGYVVDFLDFHAMGYHWPAFNVADIAICLGAFFFVLDEWLRVKNDRRYNV